MEIAIYGIFEDEKCIYVGRTSDVLKRSEAHRSQFGKLKEFRVLKRTSVRAKAGKIEKEMITHYKKLGQANFNADFSEPKSGTLPLSRKLHYELKIRAAESGTTMRKFAESLLWLGITTKEQSK